MSDAAALADVIASLEEKLPSHTFRAVLNRADALGSAEREALLRGALENRERDEAWTAKQKAKE